MRNRNSRVDEPHKTMCWYTCTCTVARVDILSEPPNLSGSSLPYSTHTLTYQYIKLEAQLDGQTLSWGRHKNKENFARTRTAVPTNLEGKERPSFRHCSSQKSGVCINASIVACVPYRAYLWLISISSWCGVPSLPISITPWLYLTSYTARGCLLSPFLV